MLHILSILTLSTLHDLARNLARFICYKSCQFLPYLPCMILLNLARNLARFICYRSCQFLPYLPCMILPNLVRQLSKIHMHRLQPSRYFLDSQGFDSYVKGQGLPKWSPTWINSLWSYYIIGRVKRAPHWGVQSRFRVIYIYVVGMFRMSN